MIRIFVTSMWLTLFVPLASVSASGPNVIYEIFTRSFQDSNGDGVGDLDGVISRLDYLNDGTPKSLGVDAIWLTPIFPSPSYHGYDIVDYEQVNPDYGDLSRLKRLLTESHRRGIRVLLDIAVNHTSNSHTWFLDRDTGSDFYLWATQPLSWFQSQGAWYPKDGEYYFSSFSPHMPDLNWKNPEVLARIQNIFRFWAALGVDGFRLDAAKFLVKGPNGEDNQPETHEIWKKIVQSTHELFPDVFFVGEVWDSATHIASYYGAGDELTSAFDFPIAGGLRDSLQNFDEGPFAQALKERITVQPTPDFAAPFVSNHDMPRLASLLENDFARLKLAALAFLTLPGPAEIYYGDEIGLPGGSAPGDLAKRTPMQWDNSLGRGFSAPGKEWNPIATLADEISVQSQQSDSDSILSAYRSLIHLRTQYPELSGGVVSEVLTPSPGVLIYMRSVSPYDGRKLLVVINFSNTDLASIQFQAARKRYTTIKTLYGSANADLTFRRGKNRVRGIRVSGLRKTSGSIFLIQ